MRATAGSFSAQLGKGTPSIFSEKSVTDTCAAVGYANPCSFFQNFRQCVSMIPKTYRNISRERARETNALDLSDKRPHPER